MIENDFNFDRLWALTAGSVAYHDDEDVAFLIEEEEKLVDALLLSPGGTEQAARKLKILAMRLRADGHDDCAEGWRNLALLESALADLSRTHP